MANNIKRPAAAMEMAAKYICNHHCGRCPLLVVKFPCPGECTLDTVAWQCWITYFQRLAERTATAEGGRGGAVGGEHSPAGRS
ncbi:MAG: hypothetical protein ACYCYR_12645 [Desulfobulbaceae bacterium]